MPYNFIPPQIQNHPVVSEAEWLAARQDLLKKEKAMSLALDDLARQRRDLPWVRVTKNYTFTGPDGQETLAELFGKNSQLMIYHFMYAPGETEGCVGCSMMSDHMAGPLLHLPHHDVSLVVVSRAPYPDFQAFKQRMGWTFKWLSSYGTDFNYDFHVSFKREDLDNGEVFYNYKWQKLRGEDQPGISVFIKNAAGEIFHTYSTYERGLDILHGADNYLDLTPRGRQDENGSGAWWNFHDRYEDGD